MRTMCAWCGQGIVGSAVGGGPISHGICAACAAGVLDDAVPVEEFLETLVGPVLLVGEDGGVVAGNQSALGFTRRPRGTTIGLVVECVHAREPGGCGHTVHCSGCAIRSAVEHTRRTGQGHRSRAVWRGGEGPPDDSRVRFEIDTELVGDYVFLRLAEPRSAAGSTPR